MQLLYSKNSLRDLKCLDKLDAKRILSKLQFFCSQENPLSFAKKLSGFKKAYFRFRIGDYRAIFKIDKDGKIQILKILAIKHRREIY